MLASVVVVVPTRGNMMQRTPENQVQQQCGDGGETTNDRHKNILRVRCKGIIGYYGWNDQISWPDFKKFEILDPFIGLR